MLVVTKSTAWNRMASKKKKLAESNEPEFAKQSFKNGLKYPLVDHPHTFAMKSRGQKGPPNSRQTFVVSFAYPGGLPLQKMEENRSKCESFGLRMHYEPTVNREHAMWLVVISDEDVHHDRAIEYAKNLSQKLQREQLKEKHDSEDESARKQKTERVRALYVRLEEYHKATAEGREDEKMRLKAFFGVSSGGVK
jgi:hypothetical protein